MSRIVLALALAVCFFAPVNGDNLVPDDGPPISITSPDTGTTYAYGSLKTHSLYWDKKEKVLVARLTFTDTDTGSSQSDDTLDFRLPGVNFDEAKGLFTATAADGEVIPIAHFKKSLFVKSIETLPNAAVRVRHPRGVVTVILEAISPNDPAMHPQPENPDSDGSHTIDLPKILN